MKTVEKIKKTIEKDVNEMLKGRAISQAIALNDSLDKNTKKEYLFNVDDVQYFVGNPESEIVMVHLNPKKNGGGRLYPGEYSSFEKYVDFYTNFGTYRYGDKAKTKHNMKFDGKIVELFKGADIMDFDKALGNKRKEVEKAMNEKFQIELIPYGSSKFNYRIIPKSILEDHINRVLNWILLKDRKVVLFCGKVFVEILKNNDKVKLGKGEQRKLKLTKGDGEDKYYSTIIPVSISGLSGKAFILPSFSRQGINQLEYGKFLKNVMKS